MHKLKLLIISIFTLFIYNYSFGQYTVEWAKTFGGDGWDEANTCVETREGFYMAAGFARWQEHNLWAVKMYPDSRDRWAKTFVEYSTTSAKSMIQTELDSAIVITGYIIKKREFQSDLLLLKIDTLGNIIWQKTYGGSSNEEGLKVIETKDHCLAICGYSSSNVDGEPNWYVIKTDSYGNLMWEREFGGSNDDRALSIAETFDGGFVVTGYIGGGDGGQKLMSLIKLDKDGNDEWSQTYYYNNWCAGAGVVATRDSNIVIAGYTRPYPILDYDVLVVKCDMNGDTIWSTTYGNENWDEATDIIQTYDDAYVVCGFSSSNSRDISSFLMLKYDSRGNLIWERVLKRKSQDYAKCVVETRDNGLLLAGTTSAWGKNWDMAVLKMKNVERSDMKFSFPADSVSTTVENKMQFKFCLNSFGIPTNVRVTVNDVEQVNFSEFKKLPPDQQQKDCDYPLAYTVNLVPGKNVVKFIVKDYKRYEFIKERTVYLLPKYDVVR